MEQEQSNQTEQIIESKEQVTEPVNQVVEPHTETVESTKSTEPVKPSDPVELMDEIQLESTVPVKPVENLIPEKYLRVFQLIQLMLSSNEKFVELTSKAKITLTVDQSREIKNTLDYLIRESNGSKLIANIVDATQEALSDNKLELHEIPKLINVIHDSLRDLKSIVITTGDIGLLIKLILFILIETNLIKLSTQDFDLVVSVIDMSVVLLNKSVEIKLPKTSKCFCF